MSVIDKTYHHLLETILKDGFTYEDPNRKGVNRIQIPSYQFVHDFKDGFPAITTKKLYWKGIVGELLWILRGDTNIKYLVDNGINIWNKDAYNFNEIRLANEPASYDTWLKHLTKESGNLGRVYGAQLRDWTVYGLGKFKKVDQISNLIKGLKENPMGTRHIVTAWNPAELDDMALPPCHWSFEILVEPLSWQNRRILSGKDINYINSNYTHKDFDLINVPKYQFTLKWHQRSVDTFLGLPFNIASYALLAHIIGKLTDMLPKGIIGDLSNVHIYEPHLDAVREQLGRSTDMFNSKCELEDFNGFKMDMRGDIDQWLNSKEISDFKLTEHSEQPIIKAEMLTYNN